jgi:alkanesulfonate monooxygenase SsuD/methylene tetrahydromethanopterin reductase-like flavin-dependent oxidoreductase (luciferase family)
MSLEFYLFLPQMRMSMDHLAPPGAFNTPMFEAMVTNTWLAAHTERLRIGSLVLCDAFRHPAVLARQAVSIDHASRGRFDLGIGWGSVPSEFVTFGTGTTDAPSRVGRLKETLEILKALWAGETVDYAGRYFTMQSAKQEPLPLGHIPIVIGGAGKKTMELVAAHADWWNVHIAILDRLDQMRPLAGNARLSLQVQVAFVPFENHRQEITETARRRFGTMPVVGSAAELVDHFGSLAERGVQRAYVWFCDFAQPETLAAFGEEVIRPLA